MLFANGAKQETQATAKPNHRALPRKSQTSESRKSTEKGDFLRRQREEEDFRDEHEDPRLDSSSEESICDESIQDEPSSAEEDVVIENKRGDSTCEGLCDDDGGVQLESEERTFKPT